MYEFRSALNGHCLQVENRSTVEGELVGLATCTGAAYQQWQLL
ncbi:RICIN domain-containing protein [Actinoplanes sp. NPDC051470]